MSKTATINMRIFASLSRYNNQKEVIHHVQDCNNQYAHRTDNQSAG